VAPFLSGSLFPPLRQICFFFFCLVTIISPARPSNILSIKEVFSDSKMIPTGSFLYATTRDLKPIPLNTLSYQSDPLFFYIPQAPFRQLTCSGFDPKTILTAFSGVPAIVYPSQFVKVETFTGGIRPLSLHELVPLPFRWITERHSKVVPRSQIFLALTSWYLQFKG